MVKLKCKVCELEKESSDFFKDAGSKTGYRSDCKSCFNKNKKNTIMLLKMLIY